MVFQDPFSSLNPRLPVGVSIAEPLNCAGVPRKVRKEQTAAMLERVGLLPEHARRYPHQFSGGQRQRIAIARAIIQQPKLIVCDEPVSSLDTSVQAQMLNLFKELQSAFQLSYLFISHDLNVVGYMCDRITVMYLGKIVEFAPRNALLTAPAHPYTQALLRAAPARTPTERAQSPALFGEPPSPLNPPSGCPFHPRCPKVMPVCTEQTPDFAELSPGHAVCCHQYAGSR
jgi:peptide/nickel transport system ATP-binding protein